MKNWKVRTKLDQERQNKVTQGEGKEYLDEITQDDEAKAADIIIATQKVAEEKTKEDEVLKKLALEQSQRYSHKEYVHKLAELLNSLAQQIDLPAGYYYRVNFNETKVNLIIHHGKDSFGRGIVPTEDIKYDFHAIGVLATQAENTIDYMEERGAYRKDGLILPPGMK